jgi:hypothetical protein
MLDADEMSRVVDVNLKGIMYGARYALEVFSEQHYGNLINVSSVLGEAGMPLQSPYVATKYGIVGFTQALREELLAGPYPDISASVVLPGSMDTPFFTHARSKLEQKPKPFPPVYHPIKTVEALVRCAANPKPEVVVDGMNPLMIAANRLMPRVFERTMAKQGIEQQVSEFPDNQQDNLFEPMPDTQSVRGEFGTSADNLKTYAKAHPFQTALVLSLPTLLLINSLRRNGGKAHQAEFQEQLVACMAQ